MNSRSGGLPGSSYARLLHNRTLLLLWGGQVVSIAGDVFFNLAAMWVVYTQSGSILQTAVIQAIWHLPSVLFGPIAGVVADRWERNRIMVATNVLSAFVVAAVAGLFAAERQPSPFSIFAAVFLLNSLAAFLGPARFAVMPEVVGRDLLATAAGLFTTLRQGAALLGNSLAGLVITVAGAPAALSADAASFLVAALTIAVAYLPVRAGHPTVSATHPSLLNEIRAGWHAMVGHPTLRTVVWLGALLNVSSFLGPLYPALVTQRLHGDAAAFGALEAVAVAGEVIGGIIAGPLEGRWGGGRLLWIGWASAGCALLGIAVSTSFPLTVVLMIAQTGSLTVSGACFGALTQALVPSDVRGRVGGLMSATSVIAIPVSALVGGWLADQIGVVPLFAFGGVWIVGVAGLAWSNRTLRGAHLEWGGD